MVHKDLINKKNGGQSAWQEAQKNQRLPFQDASLSSGLFKGSMKMSK